jgi:hypothetical protein
VGRHRDRMTWMTRHTGHLSCQRLWQHTMNRCGPISDPGRMLRTFVCLSICSKNLSSCACLSDVQRISPNVHGSNPSKLFCWTDLQTHRLGLWRCLGRWLGILLRNLVRCQACQMAAPHGQQVIVREVLCI